VPEANGRGSIQGVNGVTIRPARPADFEELKGMFARAQLGGPWMVPELAFVQRRLGGEAFVADAGGELVGASAAVAFGVNGWIGGVAVLPERRGAGLGSALTAVAAHWTAEAGAGTVSLHATAMGRPVYERLGFAADGRWLRLTITAGDGPAGAGPAGAGPAGAGPAGAALTVAEGSSARVRAARAGDLDAVLALDREVTGEERSRLLRLVWGSGCFVAEDADGRVAGFHAPKPVGGPGGATIATDDTAGEALQAAWQQPGSAASVVLPESNAAGRRALEALGYQVTGGTTLMRRGPAPAYHPERVFGGFNLFWG
jgi:GNAT superfamily N-acetyltransferase